MVTRLALSDFPRMQQLPQYIFKQVIGWMEKARAAGEDIVDFGMGNPDGAPPPPIPSRAALPICARRFAPGTAGATTSISRQTPKPW